MSQLCQRTFALAAVLCLAMLVPGRHSATVAHTASAATITAAAATGPTLPPYPWCG